MKIIQAMKQIKDLKVKADDLKKKVSIYCADLSNETPLYGADQKKKIDEWVQGYQDINKEIAKLKLAIQKTNLATEVTIELGGIQVTKNIAEWVHRRREGASMDHLIWLALSDRGLREGTITLSNNEKAEVKIRRYFDPSVRDTKVELYRSEPSIIDSTLEVVNATTELVV